MKKLVVVALAAGLVAASFTAPAVAKRKRPPPAGPVSVEQKLFLHQDSESCQTPHTFLSLVDGPDLTCFYQDGGAPYEVANAIVPTTTAVWPVEGGGVPFVFDTAKKITGEITVHGFDAGAGPTSAGQARFDVVVVADLAGGAVEVGRLEETWTTTPGDVHVVTLEMAIDRALAGQPVRAFRVETTIRGASLGPHMIELDDPAAFVIVPTLK